MNRDDTNVLLRAVLIALLVIVAAAALAADKPEPPGKVFCYLARQLRSHFPSDRAAEEAARADGASQATIDKAKRCPR